MEVLGSLNWLAVAAATAVAFVWGGIWYGPLFRDAWLAALGKTVEDIPPSVMPFVVSLFTAALTAVVMAWLVVELDIDTLAGGALLGLVTGVGFIATAMAGDSAFCGWGLRLFLILAGYRVTYAIMMGAILGAWR